MPFGIGAVPRSRTSAPRAVRRERPDADQREHEHDRLEQRVHRAEREQHGGDRIADAGRRRCWRRPRGASVGAGSGSVSTQSASVAVTAAATSGGDDARQRARPLGARRGFGAAQARRRADQQRAGQAAADGGLGQRHVDAVQLHPDQRQQQAVGDEADDRGERVARERSSRPPAPRSGRARPALSSVDHGASRRAAARRAR